MRGVYNFSQPAPGCNYCTVSYENEDKKNVKKYSIFLAEQILVIMSVSTLIISNVWQGSWRSFLKKMSKKSVCYTAFLTGLFMYAFTRHKRSKNREKKDH